VAAGLVVVLLALAGCTSSGTQPPPDDVTHTRTVTSTRPPGDFVPPQPAFRRPLPPGAQPGKHEKDHSCPYIKTGLNVTDDTGPNLANLEGDRVYRNTILTNLEPVGCRFYFYAPPYAAIAEIQPHTFATPTEAYNAMIATAKTGHNLIVEKDFARGATGICFQTKFYSGDGNKDWAFVFAKGTTMVIVYAFQTNTSRNAFYIARAIAKKF
jgi:hypothetical protein